MIKKNILVFGASGSIGRSIVERYSKVEEWHVLGISRNGEVSWNANSEYIVPSDIENLENKSINAIVWAQGMNLNDNILTYNSKLGFEMYQANIEYIIQTLSILLSNDKISDSAKLCIISSIWQDISRNNKFSYSVTKSALKGLVNSLSNDLGHKGILVNAVLPGALDTKMTRENLTQEAIEKFEASTQFNRLATMDDVVNTVEFLCSDKNTGITGNFIKVDLGFSHVRNY